MDVTRAANFWGLMTVAARVFVQDAERSRWRLRSTGVHSFADLGFGDDLGFIYVRATTSWYRMAMQIGMGFGKFLARVLFQELGVSVPSSVFHVLFTGPRTK